MTVEDAISLAIDLIAWGMPTKTAIDISLDQTGGMAYLVYLNVLYQIGYDKEAYANIVDRITMKYKEGNIDN